MNEVQQSDNLLTEDGQPRVFDLGHRGDFDYTQIERCLALTPWERLERHESWRLFVKEALENARLRQRHSREAGASGS